MSEAYLEARREDVLEAALTCFARKGFARTTMREIAEEAGVSYGILYHYFASKREIITAVGERGLAQRAARFEKAELRRAAPDVLAEYLRLSLERWAAPESAAEIGLRMNIVAECAVDRDMRALIGSGLPPAVDRLAAIVRRGQLRGELAQDLDPNAIARVVIALNEGLVGLKAIDPEIDTRSFIHAALALLNGRLLVDSGEERRDA